MTLRLTGGKLKGKKIHFSIKGDIRPTSSMIREAIFNRLSHSLIKEVSFNNLKFVDLFSGSGIMGFEALSRNFGFATFIDKDKNTIDRIKKTLEILGLGHKASTQYYDASKLKLSKYTNEVIFLDPPYNSNLYKKTLDALIQNNFLAPNSIIVIESSSQQQIKFSQDYSLFDIANYGSKKITILKYISIL
ncbi:16S rRNA (guanine(966)-N(2))-methyltransferase RsmD [Alphaproteobacteria bacterium]|nr:16S rRNA (guanine(966)-N(2))-methyltransferase RsmD [Alphaproteobacteria bacterium]